MAFNCFPFHFVFNESPLFALFLLNNQRFERLSWLIHVPKCINQDTCPKTYFSIYSLDIAGMLFSELNCNHIFLLVFNYFKELNWKWSNGGWKWRKLDWNSHFLPFVFLLVGHMHSASLFIRYTFMTKLRILFGEVIFVQCSAYASAALA